MSNADNTVSPARNGKTDDSRKKRAENCSTAPATLNSSCRLSRGNLLFPTQVGITPTSVVHYTPEMFGGQEQSMHMAHVASVKIDRNLFFADVMIESSGGASPVRCHGHRKADAVEMKRLIEQYQSDHLSRSR